MDIRTTRTPLQKRLAKATAGVPGDDLHDILLLRDGWVLRKARESTKKERHHLRYVALLSPAYHSGIKLDSTFFSIFHLLHMHCSIRLGTFNVNDKLPSQDLSSWVNNAKTTHLRTVIPPLKNVSPLSLGEVARDLLESSKDITESGYE